MADQRALIRVEVDGKRAKKEIQLVKKAWIDLDATFKRVGMSARDAGRMATQELGKKIDTKGRGSRLQGRVGRGEVASVSTLTKEWGMTGTQAAGMGQRGAAEDTARTEKLVAQRQKVTSAIQKQLRVSEQLRRLESELGHNAGITTVQVIKQRDAIDGLTASLHKARRAKAITAKEARNLSNEMKNETNNLRMLQPEVEKYNQKMRFMGGAGVTAQKGIRNVGAAAQGSMLAMSAMNGDVLGLAFSLIFLQFAANIPVALGFGAIALAGALAFKRIKGVLAERREVEKMGNAFYIVTRSTQAMGIATQKAEAITKGLSLGTKVQEEADKALIATQQNLRANGIEPTSDALRVALNAFLIAKAGGEEYEAALESTLQATNDFATNGIPKLGSVGMTMEEMNARGSAALAILTRSLVAQDVPMAHLVEQADTMGIEVSKSYREAGRAGETLGDVQDNLIGQIDDGNVMALKWMKTLENWGNEVLANAGDHKEASVRIDEAFDLVGQKSSEEFGKGGRVAVAWDNFNAQLTESISQAGNMEDGIKNLADESSRSAKAGGLIELEERLLNIANNAKFLNEQAALAGPQTLIAAISGASGDMELDALKSKLAEEKASSTIIKSLTPDYQTDSLTLSNSDMAIDALASQMYEKDTMLGSTQIININVTGNTVGDDEELATVIANKTSNQTHMGWGEVIFNT